MGEWMYRSKGFLIWALVGGEWSASRLGRFTPGKRAPGTLCVGCWVDHRAGLDDVEKRKFLTLPDSNSDFSVVQPVANRYTDCAIRYQHYHHHHYHNFHYNLNSHSDYYHQIHH
jgi:hypothetical protein